MVTNVRCDKCGWHVKEAHTIEDMSRIIKAQGGVARLAADVETGKTFLYETECPVCRNDLTFD